MVSRGFPNIISSDLAAVKEWYVDLLGWETEFDSDWFVHLKAADAPGVELGIIAEGHDIVPAGATAGGMLTFVVDDVDELHAAAVASGHVVVEPPTNLFYGQRRMVLRDPAGTLVDISSECEPSQEFLDSLPHLSEHPEA